MECASCTVFTHLLSFSFDLLDWSLLDVESERTRLYVTAISDLVLESVPSHAVVKCPGGGRVFTLDLRPQDRILLLQRSSGKSHENLIGFIFNRNIMYTMETAHNILNLTNNIIFSPLCIYTINNYIGFIVARVLHSMRIQCHVRVISE